MKLYVRIVVLVALAVTMSLLVGCSRHDNNERYILVTVNSKLPYWQPPLRASPRRLPVWRQDGCPRT